MNFSVSTTDRRGNRRGLPLATVLLVGFALLPLAACIAPVESKKAEKTPSYINNKTKFSSADFGVEGSPRVTTERRPDKGTGRYQVGKPYQIKGKWYTPKEDPNLEQVGLASWYGPNFHGRLTANGEIYDQFSLTGAHPTMPLPSYAKVTNLENGRSLTVRINDRGPYAHGRVVDLSAQAAKMLGYEHQGVTKVKVEYVGKARMDGLDEDFLMASYQGPDANGVSPSGTMIAMAETGDPTRPAAAIDAGFSQTGDVATVVALSAYPVPMSRPTLFEGIPLDGIGEETIVYQQVPRPLAYSGEELQEQVWVIDPDYPYLGEMPDRKITIHLGRFASLGEAALLLRLFEQAGSLKFDNATGVALLVTTEKFTNSVLQYASEIGIESAYIR